MTWAITDFTDNESPSRGGAGARAVVTGWLDTPSAVLEPSSGVDRQGQRRSDGRSKLRVAAVVVVAACALAVGIAVVVTRDSAVRGHWRAVAPSPVPGSSGSGPVPVAQWSPPPAGSVGLPSGAYITSVVRYGGELVGVGGIWRPCVPTTPSGPCGSSRSQRVYEPVVWTSPDGGTWRQVWFPGGIDPGQAPLKLVVTTNGLILVGGDSLWRSTDAVDWLRVAPPATEGGSLQTVTWSNGILVASFRQLDTQATVATFSPDTVWMTRDEDHWLPVSLGLPGLVSSAVASATGFVLAGQSGPSRAELHPTVWLSNNGTDWETAVLGGYPGSVSSVAAEGSSVFARGVVNGDYLDWTSVDGGASWSVTQSVGVANEVPAVSVQSGDLVAVSDGFLLLTVGPTLWWSATGVSWSALASRGAPSASPFPLSIEGLFPDGDGLGVLVSEPANGSLANGRSVPPRVQVWHVTLVPAAPPRPTGHDIRLRYTVSD